MKKSILLLPLTLFFFTLSLAQVSTNKGGEKYEGYRIHVGNIKVLKKSEKKIAFELRLTNTGRETIDFKSDSSQKEKMVINVEEKFQYTEEGRYQDLLEKAVLEEKIELRASASQKKEVTIKIPKNRRYSDGDFVINPEINKKDAKVLINKDICGDLAIDTIKIIKKKKKSIIIEATVINQGNGGISIIGKPNTQFDNVAMKAYFSGTPKLSAGALPAGLIYLTDKGIKESKGILFPNQSYTVTFKVSLKHRTKYNKTMILFLDCHQVLMECDETNNQAHLLVE